jgi:hypothetical protein
MADVLPMFFLVAAGLALSLMLLALWHSLRAVLSPGDAAGVLRSVTNTRRDALLHEKNELLATLRELRSEHELGKLSDADFAELDSRHRARAREVLRELDEEIEPLRAQARAIIEAALGAGTTQPLASPGAWRDATVCPACGTTNDADAVFCKKCGTKRGNGPGAESVP